MRRCLLVSLVLVAGCSKSAGTKEKPDDKLSNTGGDRIAVPGATGGPAVGAEGTTAKSPADEKRFRLQPEEGTLVVQAPSEAKAGTEAVATIVVTPGSEYYVNTEFPTKVTLENAEGVTIAKAELKAGGQGEPKGDAAVFEKSKLEFAVKLTPTKSGSHTINGQFKFAVCDKAGSTCLAKKEPIAISVAAQ